MAHQNLAQWHQLMKVSILVSDHAWNWCPPIINMCTTIGPSSSSSSQPNLDFPSSDIGELLEKGQNLKTLSREHKHWMLSTEPNPNPSFYPKTHCVFSGHLHQFQPSWLKHFPWLQYSAAVDGAFCQACALFAPESVGRHVLGQFVSTIQDLA